MPKLTSIIEGYRSNVKFVDKMKKLVEECSPPNSYRNQHPTLKQTWRWIKTLMEEYMKMKKYKNQEIHPNLGYLEADKEIQRVVMEHLRVEERTDIIAKLKKLIYEHSNMSHIVKKIKKFFKIEWVNTLNEVDRKIDQELEMINDTQGQEDDRHQ